MHITLHGNRGPPCWSREAIGRCFAVSSTLLAIAFDVARSAEKAALPRETDRCNAGDDISEPGANRKGRMLQCIGDEPAVQPRLIYIADLESECLSNAVIDRKSTRLNSSHL